MLRSIEEEKTKNGKGKRTNNDLYNTTQTKKIEEHETHKKPRVNYGASERLTHMLLGGTMPF